MDVTPEMPETVTGRLLLASPPLPRAPFEPAPQHIAAPPAIVAHEWNAPARTDVAPAMSTTATGVVLPDDAPLPS